MRRRAAELAQRRLALIRRIAAERELVGMLADDITGRLERIDDRIDGVRRFFHRPWLLLGAAGALVALLGPRRLVRIASRGAFWVASAQRVLRLVRPTLH